MDDALEARIWAGAIDRQHEEERSPYLPRPHRSTSYSVDSPSATSNDSSHTYINPYGVANLSARSDFPEYATLRHDYSPSSPVQPLAGNGYINRAALNLAAAAPFLDHVPTPPTFLISLTTSWWHSTAQSCSAGFRPRSYSTLLTPQPE